MALKLKCAGCGAAMDHHADKLFDPTDAAEAAAMMPGSDGMIAEIHTCPECQATEMRLR